MAISSNTDIKQGEPNWYIDSGASNHMCNDKNAFESLDIFDNPMKILVGNDEYIEAYGKGSVPLPGLDESKVNCSLSNVLFVPKIAENLVSVGTAADNGVMTHFYPENCVMFCNDRDKTVIAYGSRIKSSGLYLLDQRNPGKALYSKVRRTLSQWHSSLGHINNERIKSLEKGKLVDGFGIIKEAKTTPCSSCPPGKAANVSHPPSSRLKATKIGEIVHLDLIGKLPESLGGNKYLFVLTDEASNYITVFPLKSKDLVHEKLEEYFSIIESQTTHRVKTFWSDCGTEFLNQHVKTLLAIEHATLLTSAPRTPQQNGKAERSNRSIIETARTMRLDAGLPDELWAEACSTAAYLLNRVSHANGKDITPYELWFGRRPNLSHLHRFGEQVQVLDKARNGNKWSTKTKNAHIVGFTMRSNSYRCYVPSDRTVQISCDVIFRQHHVPFNRITTDNINDEIGESLATLNSTDTISISADTTIGSANTTLVSSNTASNIDSTACTFANIELTDTNTTSSTNLVDTQNEDNLVFDRSNTNDVTICDSNTATCNDPTPVSSTKQILTTRDNEDNHQLERFQSTPKQVYNISKTGQIRKVKPDTIAGYFGLLAKVEPSSYKEAMHDADADLWAKAIGEEIKSMEENKVWSLTALPKGKKAISTKWVCKIKLFPNGDIDKYKARLVARGFDQRPGLDFVETFAPVVRQESIRLLFALTAKFKMQILQFDIATAFLNGQLDEEVYLEIPEGLKSERNQALRLHKAIYGLKQSSRCWCESFTKILHKCGLSPIVSDPCIFQGKVIGHVVYVAIYVDDGLAISESSDALNNLFTELNKQLTLKKVHSSIFVGFEFKQDKSTGDILLHQTSYINKMIKAYNMSDCCPVKSPMSDISSLMNSNDNIVQVPYRELIGSLLYAACATRPDILFTVNTLAKFNNAPQAIHWTAAKRVLRYLQGTANLGIRMKSDNDLRINC